MDSANLTINKLYEAAECFALVICHPSDYDHICELYRGNPPMLPVKIKKSRRIQQGKAITATNPNFTVNQAIREAKQKGLL